MRHPLTELSRLEFVSNTNYCRMDYIEFFANFSCSCKKIRLNDGSELSLSTSYVQPLCPSASRLSTLARLLALYTVLVCSLAVLD